MIRGSSNWRGLRRRLRWGRAPRTPEAEVDDEIRFHLEERADALRAQGLPEASARREAERRFGPLAEHRRELLALTESRRQTTARRFSLAVWAEAFRTAFRMIRRRPLPAVAAVLSLAFGLSAVAGVGTLADEILLRPPPGIADPDKVAYLDASRSAPRRVLTTLRSALGSEVALAGHGTGSLLAIRGNAAPERVIALGVDGSYFSVLRTRMSRGRALSPEDDAERRRVAVVSADLASRHFPAGRVIGEVLRVEGRPFTVVGVAEPSFGGTFHGFPADVWLPLTVVFELKGVANTADPESGEVEMIARLPTAVDRDGFSARVDAALAGLRQNDSELAGIRIEVHPLTGIDPELWGPAVAFVGLLGAVAIGLLAVAATPVAMWLLARVQQRQRELAIRAAIGGGRSHLMALLAAEGLLVGALGAITGLGLALPSPALATHLLPPLPFDLGIVPSWRPGLILAVTAVALLIGAAAALPAAWRIREDHAVTGLGERSPGRRRGDALVVLQLMVACALLVVSGSLVHGMLKSVTADPGLDLDAVVVAQRLDVGALRPQQSQRAAFYSELVRQADNLTGVEGVGLISRFPLSLFGGPTSAVSAPGVEPGLDLESQVPDAQQREQMQEQIGSAAVDEGYFATVGVVPLQGRVFRADDAGSLPVAVVNQTLADRWFDGDALSRKLRIDGRVHRVIGVVATGRYRLATEDDQPFVYLPTVQQSPARVDLVLRSSRPLDQLSQDLRALLTRLEPDLPTPVLLSGRDVAAARLLPQRLAAGVCATLGLIGLLLSSFAVYSVAAWRVSSRRHEYGVRLGLGASPADLRQAILGDSLKLAALGVALGAGLGWIGTLAAAGVVAGVSSGSPSVFAAVASVLGASALLAGLGPALRAGRVDPAEILRSGG